MRVYDDASRELNELLREAGSEQGAQLLIPDLQRPYVWTPNKVVLLVDSLIRGWPFGTLLLWIVTDDDLGMIPSRPFWKVVDRTDGAAAAEVSRLNPPGQFRMILDGQQRLQSLLLAFGGDDWGFRLYDRDWSAELEEERPRGRYASKHWSLGHLSFDLGAFRTQYEARRELLKVDYRDVLCWTVNRPAGGRSTYRKPPNYRDPLPSAYDPGPRGPFVRLSRLWELGRPQPELKEKWFADRLRPLLSGHGVPEADVDSYLHPLLRDVKLAKVPYLAS